MNSFLRNNINFRRFTSDQYAAFYSAKGFMLGQILDSEQHEFQPQTRETLLQYFSYATDWLMELERDFIRRGSGSVDIDQTSTLIDRFAKLEYSLHDMMRQNKEVFDPVFTDVWIDLRSRILPYISNVYQQQLKPDMYATFAQITGFLIGYMNYTLFMLHELDYLSVRGARPFTYLDKMDVSIKEVSNVNAPVIRAACYREHGLLEPYGEQRLLSKIYVDERWLNTTSRKQAFNEIRSETRDCDYKFC